MPHGVEFDEWRAPRDFEHKPKGMAKWVIEHSGGLIKSERAANQVLMVLSILFFAAAIMITARNFS